METQASTSSTPKGRRAVIVAGVRTPFVKAFKELLELDAIALGVAAVDALLHRTELPRRELDSVIWGGVILPGLAPNVGREIVLDLKLPASVEAYTVTRACATGLQAVTLAAAAIERGDADVVIAGGSDSTSNAEIKLPQKVVHAMAPLAFGKATPADMLGVLAQLRLSRFMFGLHAGVELNSSRLTVRGDLAQIRWGRARFVLGLTFAFLLPTRARSAAR